MSTKPGCSTDTKRAVRKTRSEKKAEIGKIYDEEPLDDGRDEEIDAQKAKFPQLFPTSLKLEEPRPRPIIGKIRTLDLYRKAPGTSASKLVSLVPPYMPPMKIKITEEPQKDWKVGRAICPGKCGRELSLSIVHDHIRHGCPNYIQRPRGAGIQKGLPGAWKTQRQICPGPCGKELSRGVVDEHIVHGCPSHSTCCLKCPYCSELFTTHLKMIHHCAERHPTSNVQMKQVRLESWDQVKIKLDEAKTVDARFVRAQQNSERFKNYRCSKDFETGILDNGGVKRICPAYFNIEILDNGGYILRYSDVHVHGDVEEDPPIDGQQLFDRFDDEEIRNDGEDELEFSKIPLEQILSACSSRIFEEKLAK